ncbi:MAG: hypothetical protein WBP03_05035 [Candidatus Saccharimonadales bacterium]
MSKNKHKHSILHVHPLHFHLGVYVSLAALLETAMKSSEGMIAVVYGAAHTYMNAPISTAHMREAETHTGSAQLSFARLVKVSGT